MRGARLCLAICTTLLPSGPTALFAQEPLDIRHFDGWRTWPLHEPGGLELDDAALGTQRTVFDFGDPTGATNPMIMDVFAGVHFRGEPALWVQWTSTGTPGDTAGTSALDALLVDRETMRILFRIAGGPGSRSWSGPYAVTQHHPDRVVRIDIADDGTVERDVLERPTNPFDFAALPYVLPFVGLEAGRAFRLTNVGSRGNLEPRDVAVRVVGRTTIADAAGGDLDVWEVQLLTNSERGLVSFYVTEEAPHFYGWHFRLVEDGRTLTRLTYRGHTVL